MEEFAGGRCERHPDAIATFSCARCGSFGCAQCAARGVESLCTTCAERQSLPLIPWEDTTTPLTFVVTLWRCLRHPWHTFGSANTKRTERAMLFALFVVVGFGLAMTIVSPPRPAMHMTPSGWVKTPGPSWPLHALRSMLLPTVFSAIHIAGWTAFMAAAARRRDAAATLFRLACYTTPIVLCAVSISAFGVPSALAYFYLATWGAAAARARFDRSAWLGGLASCAAFAVEFLIVAVSVSRALEVLRSLGLEGG